MHGMSRQAGYIAKTFYLWIARFLGLGSVFGTSRVDCIDRVRIRILRFGFIGLELESLSVPVFLYTGRHFSVEQL